MTSPEKPLPTIEQSMKYTSWSVKEIAQALKEIAHHLSALNERIDKIVLKIQTKKDPPQPSQKDDLPF